MIQMIQVNAFIDIPWFLNTKIEGFAGKGFTSEGVASEGVSSEGVSSEGVRALRSIRVQKKPVSIKKRVFKRKATTYSPTWWQYHQR